MNYYELLSMQMAIYGGDGEAPYQIEMASTGIRGFGRRPVITTSIIRYQNSKLQINLQNKLSISQCSMTHYVKKRRVAYHNITAEANESFTKPHKSANASHENPAQAPSDLV